MMLIPKVTYSLLQTVSLSVKTLSIAYDLAERSHSHLLIFFCVFLSFASLFSTNLSAGFQTSLLETQQSQYIISGGVSLDGFVDNMSKDHCQSCPAELPSLIQNSREATVPHQLRQSLWLNIRGVQMLWQLTSQRLGAAGFLEDQVNFKKLALAVRKEEQDDGGVQGKARLLVLKANF